MPCTRRDIVLAGTLGLLPPLGGCPAIPATLQAGAGRRPERVHVNAGFGISTNHPRVTQAARTVKLRGGGPFDMLVASLTTSWVVDPANSSPYGRLQGIFSSATDAWTLHAATRIRQVAGSTVPVPGNVAAVFHLHASGLLQRPLAEVLRPAIEAASAGFESSDELRAILDRTAQDLDPELARIYLQDNGSPRGQVTNPALARLLRTMAEARDEQAFWHALQAAQPGPWSERELLDNPPVRGKPRLLPLVSSAGERFILQTTGNLETWGSWSLLGAAVSASLRRKGALRTPERSYEAFVLSSILLLDRVPFAVGTLVPKVRRPSVEFDVDAEAEAIAERVVELLEMNRAALWAALGTTYFGDEASITDDRNTTHFSFADGDGFLSCTTSIGPWFGSKRAWHGAALGYSYAMKSGQLFEGQRHDVTELSPVNILRNGQPWLGMGAAGSERILGALTYLMFLKFGLELAQDAADLMMRPRLFPKDGRLRIHQDFPATVQAHLQARGFALEPTPYDLSRHLGIVNLVERVDGAAYKSGADPSSGGEAF